MTSSIPQLLLAAIIGIVMGVVYFGGLWLTLQRLPRSSHPALLALSSLLIRILVLIAVFYLLFASHWEQLVVALLGMLLVRTLMIRRIRPASGLRNSHSGGVQ